MLMNIFVCVKLQVRRLYCFMYSYCGFCLSFNNIASRTATMIFVCFLNQGVSVEAVDPVFQAKMLDMLKQTGR